MSYYDNYYFPPSRPRSVEGGIKAQSKRGEFGQTWWGRRWVQKLESFSIGARLGRGKSYARRGQVLYIDILKGKVDSAVQGSRSGSYDLEIKLKVYKRTEWKKLAESLRQQPFYVARLLSGEIPEDFERIMKEHGMPLLPEPRNDLKMECDCPDWSNPCKHIAAVIYLLAEEFDRDPFLLFELRGITREQFLYEITGAKAVKKEDSDEAEETAHASVPLRLGDDFWEEGALPDDFYGVVRTPPAPAALPKRLGKFPFWRAEESLSDVLDPLYKKASLRGLRVFQGEE